MADTTAPKQTIDLRVTLERAGRLERALELAARHADSPADRHRYTALRAWLAARIARRTGALS